MSGWGETVWRAIALAGLAPRFLAGNIPLR